MADETYEGWKNKDTWLTHLWATNDYNFYKSRHEPWVNNIAKKMKKGVYDRNKMLPAIKKYYVREVTKIAIKNGDDVDFNKVSTEEILDTLEQEAKDSLK
jgi:hypothetical protein